ncbi:hypothetical protein HYPSUDRAFT_43293 [Hypholoma sublateritium FD-334 SS-4]|uniref:F-box domain-containing protein n=1 Tax=Hypholoma sublateritium (strain FD-334 SS-4) TaxID=945553 RepID=A0A0D2L143_HYPSF|nr:hypothetical protein HYPSUDRAFT_43293 [Hypholoma sublateritium FD-334 SS-4]
MKTLKALLLKRRSSASSTPGTTARMVVVMTQPTLPSELIEAIIEEVGAKDDITTLKQCALVSKDFVYEAQKVLFRKIDLDRRLPRKKYYQRFHRLLSASPHIGEYVRELHLGDGGEEDFGTDESWITTAKSLPATLQLLPRVEDFSLSFNAELTSWKSLPADLRSSLSALFRRPALQRVALEFITRFPPQLLMALGQVRTLSLSCVEVDALGAVAVDAEYRARWTMRLENLFLRGTSPATIRVIAGALAGARTPTLRRLALTPTFEEGFADAASELITRSGEDLETLEWLPSIHFSASSGTINLALLQQLRTLRFSVSFRKSHVHGPFPEVLRLLDALTGAAPRSPVTHIEIDCHCVRVQSGIGAVWRPLDEMLARAAFAGLAELRVRMCTTTTSAGERACFVEAFQDLLPLLESRGGTRIVLETRTDLPVWCGKE